MTEPGKFQMAGGSVYTQREYLKILGEDTPHTIFFLTVLCIIAYNIVIFLTMVNFIISKTVVQGCMKKTSDLCFSFLLIWCQDTTFFHFPL